uniref:Myb/SANT-like domain-containing protein n=1 Tax=Triticum urartu TaxID=4572 RepID=A0A8R7UPM7_TRIUA
MDGDGFDVWGSQPSASGPATHAGLDLNSQAPASEGFPGLGFYGAFLQSDNDELLPGRVRGFGLPPYRPPYARRLNFGGSLSAAAGRGGGNDGVFLDGSSLGAGGGVRQRANSAAAAPSRRNQRSRTTFSGGDVRQRANSAAAAPSRRAPRSVVRGQASGSGGPFANGDEELEDDVEELASSGGPLVSQTNRAQWNDANSACLLELCLEQRAAGTYNGVQMTAEGYQAVIDGLLARRGLVYSRVQVKNQIVVLKNTHSFWRYMQVHTGLGRKPDGTIDADSEFWITHTEKKPYLRKLQWGPPTNEELLDRLFRGYTVDGSTTFVPGDDYGQNQGQDDPGAEEEEEGFQGTPTSTSNQRSQRGKRSLSTSSTLTSPLKKSKSPMVKIVKDIANTYKESVAANTKQMQKRANEKAAFSVKRCQELAFECGVEKTIESVYAMSKMFEIEYQREFFCGLLTPELRLGYFKKWCSDNNLE